MIEISDNTFQNNTALRV